MKRRIRIGAASLMVAAGLIGAVAAPAVAGEVTGNGGKTPIAAPTYQAGSICSFSGLNDDLTGTGHISRDVAGPRRNLFIPLPDDLDVSPWRLPPDTGTGLDAADVGLVEHVDGALAGLAPGCHAAQARPR